MNTYYICNDDSIKHCVGGWYRLIEYTFTGPCRELYIIDRSRHGANADSWKNAILLKDITDEIKLLLTLVDPVFQEVSILSMSTSMNLTGRCWGRYA